MTSTENLKISFVTLGCDKNLVDSEIMIGLIDREGYQIIAAEEAQKSNVIVINTCGFIMDATSEGIEHILRLASYKKSGKCKALIVTGCMAQRYEKEIFKELPEVDAVIGTTRFDQIGNVIKNVLAGQQVTELANRNTPMPEELFMLRKPTNKHFAYLKISEGCDQNCTYCTIPSIRGKHRSRTIESLVEETKMLASQGVKELILVAQDTAHYGTDLYGTSELHTLLSQVSKIDGIRWVRILYAYPEHITDQTINEIASNPKILPYLDIPIQHSHTDILKAMNRTMTTQRLKDILNKIRTKIPNITLRTTLIVGFPGEEETHFNSLVEFIKEMQFDRLGVFAYSQEEGTPASKMPNQIDEETKQSRKNHIMDIQEQISKEKLQNRIGTVMESVVEKKYGTNSYIARTFMDCYEIDGHVNFDSDKALNVGDFVNIKITHSLDHDLAGELQ